MGPSTMDAGYKIAKLKSGGENYREWACQVQALLTEADLVDFLKADAAPNNADGLKKAARCKARLILCVEGQLIRIVQDASTAKAAWEKLEEYHLGSLKIRRPLLLGEVRNLRQAEKESIAAYGERSQLLLSRLIDVELKDADMMLCDAFLQGLLPAFHSCIPTLTKIIDKGFEAVLLELKNLTRLMQGAPTSAGDVLNAQGKKVRKETRRCFYCGKVGHLKKDCRKRQADQQSGNGQQQQPSPQPGGGTVLTTTAQASVYHVKKNGIIFDSGASHHMLTNIDHFFNRRPSAVTSVTAAGGTVLPVKCEGDAYMWGASGRITLTSVLCVPDMHVDLLSGAQVTSHGAECLLKNEYVSITKDGKELLYGEKQHGLYYLNAQFADPASACVVSNALMHRRFGHPGVKNSIACCGNDEGVKEIIQNCGVCAAAKQARDSFPISTSTTDSPLQLVHMDVMGPFPIESLGGSRYVLTLLDDHTRFSAVHCLSSKAQVADKAKETLRLWQRQTGKQLKKIRTDNGSEFKSDLDRWAKEEGVEHQLSVPYTPQQNGKAERLNRTLMEKTRALLSEHSLPKSFWAAAVDTACYLRNVMPSETGKSPMELFLGEKPNTNRLRVFGCLAYVHVPKEKRNKLDDRAVPGIFAGYETACKGWRVYVKSGVHFKSVVSRDVKFMEDVSPHAVLGNNAGDDDGGDFCPELIQQNSSDNPELQQAETQGAAVEQGASGESDESGDGAGAGGYNPAGDQEQDRTATAIESDQSDESTAGEEEAQVRRSGRQPNQPVRYGFDEFAHVVDASDLPDKPASVAEALSRPDAHLFEAAMNEELTSLASKSVYEIVDRDELPAGQVPIPTKWVLEVKRDAVGRVEKYKGRLVVLGCRQIPGRDFDEVFAPTVQRNTLRIMLALAAENDFEVQQTDVKTAFLNGELDEQVFVLPPGNVRQAGKVWRLKKALYGLKQAARAWYAKLSKQLCALGFAPSQHDPCLFVRSCSGTVVYMLMHVDDALIIGSMHAVKAAKSDFAAQFEVKDLGDASYFLGLEIVRDRKKKQIWLGQSKYCRDKLCEFAMTDCKPMSTPAESGLKLVKQGEALNADVPYAALIGSLLYLSVNSRPDISFVVGVLSRFVSCPTTEHWNAAKRVLRYLKGTIDKGLVFGGGATGIKAYTDSDFAGDVDSRKSTSGVMIQMNGAPIMWSSKLQTIVTTSTCEAEYVACAALAKEALWTGSLMAELTGSFKAITMFMDNQAAITLATEESAGVSVKTKHINIAIKFVTDYVARGDLRVRYCPTEEMLADVLTKPLAKPAFQKAVNKILGNRF